MGDDGPVGASSPTPFFQFWASINPQTQKQSEAGKFCGPHSDIGFFNPPMTRVHKLGGQTPPGKEASIFGHFVIHKAFNEHLNSSIDLTLFVDHNDISSSISMLALMTEIDDDSSNLPPPKSSFPNTTSLSQPSMETDLSCFCPPVGKEIDAIESQ
ncbi:hypothetical protein OSB04_019633 [Centaurea solstitialis]|uniref:Uncharacterized protein n=1 Tax=Centaurea solstitialis TaxID=347529 RepID=A0AA38T2Z2_9ASTR|nr:hypothetical protein OSB04_019633 [Centaurea solstitialis]